MNKYNSVTVTFKESEKWMYDIISQHTSKSAFIKDCLKEYLSGNSKENKEDNFKVDIQSDFLDF